MIRAFAARGEVRPLSGLPRPVGALAAARPNEASIAKSFQKASGIAIGVTGAIETPPPQWKFPLGLMEPQWTRWNPMEPRWSPRTSMGRWNLEPALDVRLRQSIPPVRRPGS